MARTKPPARKAGNRGAQAAKNRNKHKMVLDITSKDKGKHLQSGVRKTVAAASGTAHPRHQIAFKAEPPPGYTFIPAGNPELTAALKEFSRQGDHKIFAVTTTPHAARHELSREVHRIGFHFPTQVVSQVCNYYGIRLTSGGKVIDESKEDKMFSHVYSKGGRPKANDEPKDQITINTEAKQTIKDLFPNIPDKDLFQIIKTAFQLGDNKVGTAQEIPQVRRAQLSVVAHIRHVYTDYDRLLRQVAYNDARHTVEQATLAKLVEWRGDDDQADEAAKHAAADALREVIVISDEDDSDSEGSYEPIAQADLRVEELPSSAYTSAPGRHMTPDSGIRYPTWHNRNLPQAVPHHRPTQDEVAQRDLSRYAVWDQAKQDYRSSVVQKPPTVLERIYEPEILPRSRVLVPLDPPVTHSSPHVLRTPISSTTATRIEYEHRPVRTSNAPSFIQDHNGVLYERVVREHVPEKSSQRFANSSPLHPSAVTLVRTRPSSPEDVYYRGNRHNANLHDDGHNILPSIEGSDGLPLSPRERRVAFDRSSQPRDTHDQIHERRNLRDPMVVEYPQGNDFAPRRRLVEQDDHRRPIQQHHTLREASPVRYAEPIYRSRDEPDPPRFETLPAKHLGAPASPRLLAERYTERNLVHDFRNLPYSSTNVDRATFVADDSHVNGPYPRSLAPKHEYGIGRTALPSARLPQDVPEQRPLQYGTRTYEVAFESRPYDNHVARERNMAVGREYVQPFPQETGVCYSYPAGTIVREALEPLPRQQAVHYEYAPGPARSHALPSFQ
ncbi:hypothetical protein LTR84_003086 [Exophiala bonariae]|uniref:DUF2293 domain-containing protein n=1 Tax=Exophiala bonariae TaxID=1690606 RepID=A0AAV9NAJ2_9EURO|nr:hypothetical protein LTR84_003086 [Exophiala bonariae]